jgi:hypothetical protein
MYVDSGGAWRFKQDPPAVLSHSNCGFQLTGEDLPWYWAEAKDYANSVRYITDLLILMYLVCGLFIAAAVLGGMATLIYKIIKKFRGSF